MLIFLGSVAFAAPELDAVCTWAGARWEHHATLYVPGTGRAFAEAFPRESVALDGTLGHDADALRFRADVRGEDVSVVADLAFNEDQVFHLDGGPLVLGEAGLLADGALLSVEGTRDGLVRVGPARWALEGIRPRRARALLPCERLDVHGAHPPSEAELLKRGGFPAGLGEKELPARAREVIRAEPGGRPVGRFQRVDRGRVLRVVEERDGFTRVVVPDWTGVLWHGWVRSSTLVDHEPETGDTYGTGGLDLSAAEPVRRCADPLALVARFGSTTAEVGTVSAGVPMVLGEEGDDHVAVSFPEGWIRPAEGATLLVPESALACPED